MGSCKKPRETSFSPAGACGKLGHQGHSKGLESVEFMNSSKGKYMISEGKGSRGVVIGRVGITQRLG